MRKNIANFELRVGDIAMAKISRAKTPYVEAAVIANPDLRAIFTYEDKCKFVHGNIPKEDIPYVTEKVQKNLRFLKVR